MAQLARGSVADRPWGMTLGALGMRGLTGELSVTSDGKLFRIAFQQGAVVGAHSPLASDAAVRLALTGNLITSTQVADITRRMAAAPDRDEIEMLAELARLAPDQAHRLRRRLVAQRAARTFSLDRGEFVVDDEVTVPVDPESALDVRAIVFIGAKNNLSEDRLAAELNQLGGWFKLKETALGDLAQYGFTAADKPALQMLVAGADVADIEAAHPELGERSIRATAYALAACGACDMRSSAVPVARTSTGQTLSPSNQAVQRDASSVTRMPQAPSSRDGSSAHRMPQGPESQSNSGIPRSASSSGAAGVPRAGSSTAAPQAVPQQGSGATSRPRSPSVPPPGSDNWVPRAPSEPPVESPQPARMNHPTSPPARAAAPPRRAKRNSSAMKELELLIAAKAPLLDTDVDHFTLLGVAQTASAEEIRQSYFVLARKLHPDRIASIGIVDDAQSAQRLMAQINAAFAVLNDPAKKAEYQSILSRGGEAAIKAEDARADEMAMRVLRAEEVFKQGEMALRRDQTQAAIDAFKQAVELQPNETEYQAMLAWAQFAAATDKNALATATRRALLKAAEANERSPTARYFLGRVERMLGKEKEALQHFHEVLRIKPSHSEAASEARILEQRLKGKR